jgi:hypothetical protein
MSQRPASIHGFLPTLAILLAITVDPATAGYRTTGRWTAKADPNTAWEGLAIHLVLTRGYGSHHSQILWYNSHDVVDYDFEGGVWGWNPGITPATSNCSSYPAATMMELGIGLPTKNVFCSGMTVLKSGHALVSGGTESGETGLRHLTIFDPATRTWSQQPDLAERRWYPTNTLLPDGRALISSGSTYTHLWSLGGRAAPDQGSAVEDSLQLLAGTIAAFWDPAVKVSSAPAPWPPGRDAHSGYFNRGVGAMVVFGGRTNSSFDYSSDTYYVSRKPDTDLGAVYSSFEVARSFETPRPSARIRHTAVSPGDSTTIVFGGRSVFSEGNDLWKLFKLGAIWRWVALSPTGPPPSGRQGHTALWDDDNERMLVFGGTTVDAFNDAVPVDGTVVTVRSRPS